MSHTGAQVQEYIIRTAVSGAVQGALESFGTPNLLLQTELTMVPDLIILPQPLQPVVLYQGSFAMSESQSISLNNTGNVTVNLSGTALHCCACCCLCTVEISWEQQCSSCLRTGYGCFLRPPPEPQHALVTVLSGSEMPQHRACDFPMTSPTALLCSAKGSSCQQVRLLQVVPTSNTVIGGWLSAVPSSGTVAPGKVAEVVLMYNVSANPFQGTFEADVLITTSARPVAMVRGLSAVLPGDPMLSTRGCWVAGQFLWQRALSGIGCQVRPALPFRELPCPCMGQWCLCRSSGLSK